MKKTAVFVLSLALAVPCSAELLTHGNYAVTVPDGFAKTEREAADEGAILHTYLSDNGDLLVVSFYDYDEVASALFPEGMGFYQTIFQSDKETMALESTDTYSMPCGDTANICLYTRDGQTVADSSFNDGKTAVDLIFMPMDDSPNCKTYVGMLSDVKHVSDAIADLASALADAGK